MTATPPDTQPQQTTDDGPRVSRDEMRDLGRLRRSRTDRKVAGVAGGLGRHLDVDPLILRVAFVVLTFFGGAGLLLYVACWLLVPDESSQSSPIRLDERTRSVALIIVGIIAVLALIGDSWGTFTFPWPLAIIGAVVLLVLSRRNAGNRDQHVPPAPDDARTATAPYGTSSSSASPPSSGPVGATAAPLPSRNPRKRGPILFWFTLALVVLAEGILGTVDLAGAPITPSAYPALAVGLIGTMLLVGSFFGRAGGLILAGLLATAVLVGMTVLDKWDGENVRKVPTQASAVDDRYWIDGGDLVLDLRSVTDLQNLDGRSIEVEGGVGHLEVIVPSEMDVVVTADVNGPGDIEVFGNDVDGIDIRSERQYDGGEDVPVITIDAQLGVGQIEVHS